MLVMTRAAPLLEKLGRRSCCVGRLNGLFDCRFFDNCIIKEREM